MMADMDGSEREVHYVEVVTPEVDATCEHYRRARGWEFGAPVPELAGARIARPPGAPARGRASRKG